MAGIAPEIVSGPYLANGVQTAFPFSFSVLSGAEVDVQVDGMTVSSSGYFVVVTALGGTVTFSTAPANGASVLLVSSPDYLQASEFESQGAYNLPTVNTINKRSAVRDLALKKRLDKVIPGGIFGGGVAGKFLAWDGAGEPVAATGTGADAGLRTDLAASSGAALTGFSPSGTGAVTRTTQAKLRDAPLSPADFTTLAETLTAATGTHPVQLTAGTIALGASNLSVTGEAQVIEGDSATTSLITSTGTAPVLVRDKATGTVTKIGPRFSGFVVQGKQGIRVGDPTSLIIDNDTTNSFHLGWRMDGMRAIGTGTGNGTVTAGSVGVMLAKCFDGVDAGGEIDGFETGLALVGCDINTVMAKRIWRFSKFGIYEAGTFNSGSVIGSQNTIMGMDVVGAKTGTGAISDKSTAAHIRRYNNYYEITAGAAGALDFSVLGLTAFGSNVQTTGAATTIIDRDCRVDSQGNASWVRRIDPARCVHLRVEGVQTGDTSSTPSIFVNGAGATLDYLPMHQASARAIRAYIEEVTFGPEWDGHRSKQGVTPNGDGFRITAENASSIVYGSVVTGANGVARFKGQQIVIAPSFANQAVGIFPEGLLRGNKYFASGATYEVTLLARSTAASGDTIDVQQAWVTSGGTGSGSGWTTFALTNQFKALRVLYPGRPSNDQMAGFNVRSATSTGAIEFTLSWREIPATLGTYANPLQIGPAYYWTNATSSKLYTKTGLPASDVDGGIVGLQS